MDALVAAAKKEGTLNVIALPEDWANYGAILKAFTAKYGIKISSDNPNGSSQDEINSVKNTKGQNRAPDVLDLGQSFANSGAKAGLFAPYKVATWGDIADSQKESTGLWVNDYGGYISIGCNAKAIAKCPTTFKDLDDPALKGKVALNGNPTTSNSAFSGVWATSLANGGSLDDIAPGIEYWSKLKQAGIYVPVDATPATVQSGETPIVVDWDYLNAGYADEFAKAGVEWTTAVPSDGEYAVFYSQAVSKYAPHPAAARLWQEFLYSDEGQNLWLDGFARPVRLEAMTTAGTANKEQAAKLPAVDKTVEFPTEAQTDAAKKALTEKWADAVK